MRRNELSDPIKVPKKTVKSGTLMESLAEYHSKNNNQKEAIYFYHLALQKYVDSKQDTKDIERVFQKITDLYVAMKNYDEALKCYFTILEAKVAKSPHNKNEIATVYKNIAIIYHYDGKYQDSLTYFLKSASLRDEESCLPNSLSKVEDKNELIHQLQYNLERSIQFHEKIHTENSQLVDNIDQESKQVHLTEEVLEKITKNYKAIECLCEIQGRILLENKEFGSAIACYRMCLETKMKRLGLFHREIVPILLIIGGIYEKQEKYTDALRYYKQSFRMIMKTSGNKDIGLIEVYSKIALIHKRYKKWKTALKNYAKALKLVKRWNNEIKDYKVKVELYKEIGSVFMEMNDYDSCIKFLLKGLKIEREENGLENSKNVELYLKVANLYELQGKYNKAFDYFSQVFVLQKKFFGDNHLCTQVTLWKLEKVKMNLQEEM